MVKKHIAENRKLVVDDIVDVLDADTFTALKESDDVLIGELEDLELEMDFEKTLERLEELAKSKEMITDKVLDLLDIDDIRCYINAIDKGNGWAIIQIDTAVQREKLLEFVQKEIHPFYNDSGKYDI